MYFAASEILADLVTEPKNFRKNLLASHRKSGKYFLGTGEIPGNFFRENLYTYALAQQNYRPLPKTPQKPEFSDVNSIAGSQGHLQAVSFKKPHKLRARKRCPQKPAKLHGQIATKIVISQK